MHKFLRSIGLSSITTRDQMKALIKHTIANSSDRSFTTYENDTLLAEYHLDFANNMGLAVCGELDEKDNFILEYSYPYFKGSKISTEETSVIERHASTISFAGVCEDNKIGISIIYYLLNRMEYVKNISTQVDMSSGVTLSLSCLAINGMIMMPLAKEVGFSKSSAHRNSKRSKLIEAARKGDEEAIESLTLDDLDVYSSISQKIKENDVYTLVESSFMPYGVECDQYSILGEITSVSEEKNSYTGEIVYQMSIMCNEIPMDICINKEDLFGEPKVGRRFKGAVLLQGFLNFGFHS